MSSEKSEEAGALKQYSLPLANKFVKDWDGAEPQVNCSFELTITDDSLSLVAGASRAPIFTPVGTVGNFREALWEEECAELFLAGQGVDYLEFNLSPYGEWWGAYFESYRRRDALLSDWAPHVRCESEVSDSSWLTAIMIPRAPLEEVVGSLKSAEGNITMIIGANPKQYLTWSKPTVKNPDFHARPQFVSLGL